MKKRGRPAKISSQDEAPPVKKLKRKTKQSKKQEEDLDGKDNRKGLGSTQEGSRRNSRKQKHREQSTDSAEIVVETKGMNGNQDSSFESFEARLTEEMKAKLEEIEKDDFQFTCEEEAEEYLLYFFKDLQDLIDSQSVTVADPKTSIEIANLVKTVRRRNLEAGEKIPELKGYPNALKTFFRTRNCHQCQMQHVGWLCPGADEAQTQLHEDFMTGSKYTNTKQLHCSFCSYCLKTWYNGMTVEDCQQSKCPKCMDICNCRACLRVIKNDVVEFDEQTQLKCSQYLEQFLPTLLLRSLLWESYAFHEEDSPDEGQYKLGESSEYKFQKDVFAKVFEADVVDSVDDLLNQTESRFSEVGGDILDVGFDEGDVAKLLDDFRLDIGNAEFFENQLGSERRDARKQMQEAVQNQSYLVWIEKMIDLPPEIDNARALCDRCATSLNIVGGVCGSCEMEFCPDCIKNSCFKQKCSMCREGDIRLVRLLPKQYLLQVQQYLEKKKIQDFVDLGDFGYPNGLGNSNNSNNNTSSSSSWIQQGRCRHASSRADGQNHILLQDTEDVSFGSQNRDNRLQEFQDRWKLGEPVVVTGITSKITWEPQALERAMRDLGNAAQGSERVTEVGVLDCNDWTMHSIKHSRFFSDYLKQSPENLWKCKDWPPGDAFTQKLPAHLRCFLRQLPYPEYTHPEYGILNLTSAVNCSNGVPLPPDLGPKGYIAHGRIEEVEGRDSVTKLHLDLCDALNILEQSQFFEGEEVGQVVRRGQQVEIDKTDYGGAGALWHIWRRCDVDVLQKFLREHSDEFQHGEEDIGTFAQSNPIFSQEFFLNERHLKMMEEEYGVWPWAIEQFVGEAIFVPAGCPHQVRNLRPCIKVAIDFVSPENGNVCIDLCTWLSRQPVPASEVNLQAFDRSNEDKLQINRLLTANAANIVVTDEKIRSKRYKKIK